MKKLFYLTSILLLAVGMGLAQGFEFRLRFQVFQSGLIAIVQRIGLLNQIINADILFVLRLRAHLRQRCQQNQNNQWKKAFHKPILAKKTNIWQ